MTHKKINNTFFSQLFATTLANIRIVLRNRHVKAANYKFPTGENPQLVISHRKNDLFTAGLPAANYVI